MSTNQNQCSVHVICVIHHKMVDGREDERATSVDEVQDCPDLWDVSSVGYNNTKKNKQTKLLDERVVRYMGQNAS